MPITRLAAIPPPRTAAPGRHPAPVNAFPAVAWQVPAGGPGRQPILPERIEIPAAEQVVLLPGRQGEYLAVSSPFTGSTNELVFGRIDLKTGKAAGKGVRLGSDYLVKDISGPRLTAAALSPDGTLAIRRAVDGQVALWEPGAEQPRTRPGLTVTGDGWLDWSAAGKLLVIDRGKLTARDPANGKAAFEAGEKLGTPAVRSPAGNWLIAQVDGKYLEVRDAATGECRGRFGGEGKWKLLAVSPDGTRLVGLRPAEPSAPSAGTDNPWYELHDWDLRTGEHKGRLRFDWTGGLSLRWAGPRHVLFGDLLLVDLDHHVRVGRVEWPRGTQARFLDGSPDGRLWCMTGAQGPGRHLGPAPVVFAVPPLIKPADGELAFHPGVPVRVEAALGDPVRDRRAVAVFTDVLQDAGYTLGEGGWLLRITGKAYENTGQSINFGGSGKGVPLPGVRGEIQLIAPDGSTVQATGFEKYFPRRESRYYTKTERGGRPVGPDGLRNVMENTEVYDFRGRDPAAAMLEETWDTYIRGLYRADWPHGAWKSGGKYQPLPLPVPIPVPQ